MIGEEEECSEPAGPTGATGPTGPETIEDLSLALVLKLSAPLFSKAWLMEAVPDPADAEPFALLDA